MVIVALMGFQNELSLEKKTSSRRKLPSLKLPVMRPNSKLETLSNLSRSDKVSEAPQNDDDGPGEQILPLLEELVKCLDEFLVVSSKHQESYEVFSRVCVNQT